MAHRPDFRRQELRQASRFIEGDYEGINPREFYRHLRRQLEELQQDDGFKYTTKADRQHDLDIQKEAVGDKTGVVTGRLEAQSDWTPIGSGTLTYRPWAPIGFLFILVGLAMTPFGSVFLPFYFVGPFVILSGLFVYLHEDIGEVPIEQRDTIRTLIEGEVSEKTIQTKQGKRTEMSANMSVIYSGEVSLRVTPHALSEMPWGLRSEVVHTVKDWHNPRETTPAAERHQAADSISTGMSRILSAWNYLSSSYAVKRFNRLQNLGNRSFEKRQAYAGFLTELLEAHGVRENELDRVMERLESLKGGMDVYVDREGLEPTR